MKPLLLCILFFITSGDQKINNILNEVRSYQMKQFSNPTALTFRMLDKLEFLNRHILQNNLKDSFWLINVYDNRKYFDALILSDTIIYSESLKRDTSIIVNSLVDTKEGYFDLLDSIYKGKKLPRVYDASLRSIVMKVKCSNSGKISIEGFNLNNLNEKVDQFHF